MRDFPRVRDLQNSTGHTCKVVIFCDLFEYHHDNGASRSSVHACSARAHELVRRCSVLAWVPMFCDCRFRMHFLRCDFELATGRATVGLQCRFRIHLRCYGASQKFSLSSTFAKRPLRALAKACVPPGPSGHRKLEIATKEWHPKSAWCQRRALMAIVSSAQKKVQLSPACAKRPFRALVKACVPSGHRKLEIVTQEVHPKSNSSS